MWWGARGGEREVQGLPDLEIRVGLDRIEVALLPQLINQNRQGYNPQI